MRTTLWRIPSDFGRLLLLTWALCVPLDLLAAEPMKLTNPAARWVAVRFEISPSHRPGQLDTVYTPPLPAWLETADTPGRVRVRVGGRWVEEMLLAGRNPQPGSFSDFVWTFDVASGRVISAETSGRLLQTLQWGWLRSSVVTEIEIRMGTEVPAGFARPRRLLGHEFFGFCDRSASKRCTLVEPADYNPDTGYVNAVGAVSARTGPVSIRSFSPLGEAVFSEREIGRQARN